MKVLHVIPSLSGGGAERVAIRIAEHQVNHFEVHLVTWMGEDEYGFLPDGITHHQISKPGSGLLGLISLVFSLRGLIQRIQPDCVLSHLTYTNVVAFLAKLDSPKQVRFFACHRTTDGYTDHPILDPLVAWLYRRNEIIAVSEETKRFLVQNYGVTDAIVLPNPLPLPEFDGPNPEPGPPYKLIAAGRIAPIKNYEFMIHSMCELPESYSLSIAGEGYSLQLEELASRLGVQDRVTFLGKLTYAELIERLRESHAFLMTSDAEGEPGALLEAAALGIPVVGRFTPGLSGAVQKVGGFHPEHDNYADFAHQVKSACANGRNKVPDTDWRMLHDPESASHRYCELFTSPHNG